MENITEEKVKEWIFEAIEKGFKNLSSVTSIQNKERLNVNEALVFLKERSYETTISKLYKLTAKGEIPSAKINGKLSYLKSNLLEWVENQINHDISRSNAEALLADSARRKNHTA